MSAPVPVLLMSHSLGAGGGERQLALTALNLNREKFRPHVAAALGGQWVERLEQAGVPIHWVRSRSFVSAAAAREAFRLAAYIRRERIRVVQTFDYTMNMFGVPIAALLPGVAALSNLRCNMHLIPPRYQRANRWAHRLSHRIVVNSASLRTQLVEEYGDDPQRVVVCPNGVDTQLFRPAPERLPSLSGVELVIGTVCVLRPEKNVALLIDAFGRLRQPGWRLLIVGSGPEREPLERRAQAFLSQVVFVPSVSDVVTYLRSMDIFVLPSRTEGLSNAIMEALATGCAVAATRVGGAGELILDGHSGLLFASEDQAALEAALLRLTNPALRHQLAQAGVERMQADFSLHQATLQMEQLYESLLS